jgi:hypothetical protein
MNTVPRCLPTQWQYPPIPWVPCRYLGGKIEIDVGGKTLWAQCGINLSIIGSNGWAKGK